MNLERMRVPKGDKAYPISLQDHGNPVPYRNIWIREIPSVYANTTHGGPGVRTEDVTVLREQTAAMLFARIDKNADPDKALNAALEVVTYSKKPEYVAHFRGAADAYVAMVSAWDEATVRKNAQQLRNWNRKCHVQIRGGALEKDDPLVVAIGKIVKTIP